MLNTYFVRTVQDIFADIREEYGLKTEISGSEVRYSNPSVDFTVYFEKFFEIYVCFRYENDSLRLIDMAKWLSLDDDELSTICRDQVGNEADIYRVLTNLHAVIGKLFANGELTPEMLEICAEKQREFEKEQEKAEQKRLLLLRLDKLWQEKKFSEFIALFEDKQKELENMPNNALIRKKANYLLNKNRMQGE